MMLNLAQVLLSETVMEEIILIFPKFLTRVGQEVPLTLMTNFPITLELTLTMCVNSLTHNLLGCTQKEHNCVVSVSRAGNMLFSLRNLARGKCVQRVQVYPQDTVSVA